MDGRRVAGPVTTGAHLTRAGVRRLTLLGVGAMLMSACGGPTGAAADLDAARKRWAGAAPAAYTMTIERQCFCGVEITTPVIVQVRAGQVAERRYATTGAPVDARWASSFPDVEGLFAVVQRAIDSGADRIDASYDAQLGYPTRIAIDHDVRSADDEEGYLVGAFAPSP